MEVRRLYFGLDCRTLGHQRCDLRDKTSWIAAFSSANSEYDRLSQALSVSRSLTRLSSMTGMPATLIVHW